MFCSSMTLFVVVRADPDAGVAASGSAEGDGNKSVTVTPAAKRSAAKSATR